jgi:heptaprenylglyceryl phosphate synthase
MIELDPFANESDSLTIEDLTIENRTDAIAIHGSIDITRDKKGLAAARALAALLNSIVERLDSEKLPDALPPAGKIDTVKNPFG